MRSVAEGTVAVAVTLTKDGDDTGYLDGAAVLAHTVRLHQRKYPTDLVAIVHPRVQKSRPALRKVRRSPADAGDLSVPMHHINHKAAKLGMDSE